MIKATAGFVSLGTSVLIALAMATSEPVPFFNFLIGLIIVGGTFTSGWINLKEGWNDD